MAGMPTVRAACDARQREPVPMPPCRWWSRRSWRRPRRRAGGPQWAAVLRQIFEVDPLVCPRCAGAMRIVACITQAAVIGQILTHLRTRAAGTRAAAGAQPGARSPPAPGASVVRSTGNLRPAPDGLLHLADGRL